MINSNNKTKFVSKAEALKTKKYFLFDAKGKTLGRFATEISKILRGKHKPDYTPNIDTGDFVVVINADQIKVTGTKEARKVYRHHTGWVGGLVETPYREMLKKKPEYIIYKAVKGMLPVKSKLARQQLKKLKIFRNEEHKLHAQKPLVVNI